MAGRQPFPKTDESLSKETGLSINTIGAARASLSDIIITSRPESNRASAIFYSVDYDKLQDRLGIDRNE